MNVELAGKLTAGEYTVNVKGLTETALTKSVTVADEKVSKIEFGSEKAILAAGDNAGTASATATVGYKVLNQYGEDITKTVSVSASTSVGSITSSDIDSSKGTIAIKGIAYPKSGDKIVLTLVHGASATTATQTFAISDSSKVDSVAVAGLYNGDNKELSEDTRTNNFYLKLNAKDQYDNALKATDLTGNVIITSSNPNVVAASAADIKEITIDGTKTAVVELDTSAATAGKSTITVISLATGKTNQFEAEVKAGSKVNTLSLSQPELAVSGEKVELPFEAIGIDGNAVDKKSLLDNVQFNVGGLGLSNSDVSFVTNSKGVTKLVLDTDGVAPAGGTVTITAITPTQKVSTLVVNVKEAAKPMYISGLKNIEPNLVAGRSITLTIEDR